jgi:hypothetical protein
MLTKTGQGYAAAAYIKPDYVNGLTAKYCDMATQSV